MSNRLQRLLAVLLALLVVSPALGQGNSPATWRALYEGEIGGQAATLDLTLGSGDGPGFAFGRLRLSGTEVWDGVGEGSTASDAFTLAFQPALPYATATTAIDVAYHGGMTGAEEGSAPLATLTGSRGLDWAQDGATLTVILALADGTTSEGRLERVAQYTFVRLVQGRLDVGYAYPRFQGADAPLNELLEARSASRFQEWVHEGRELLEGGEALGWAWTHHEGVDLVGSAGPYRSLVSSYYYYTGGAHPNSHRESVLVEMAEDAVRLLTLEALFAPGSGWEELLSSRLLEELERLGAAWVEDGSITELGEAELATFTLGPRGLTFHFDPYAVGPYVQGGFTVTLDYAELQPFARPGGALEAFTAADR